MNITEDIYFPFMKYVMIAREFWCFIKQTNQHLKYLSPPSHACPRTLETIDIKSVLYAFGQRRAICQGMYDPTVPVNYHKFNSLAPGFNLNLVISTSYWGYPKHPWYCPHVKAIGPHWWLANIGSGNRLMPSGNKWLSEQMLTQICAAIWFKDEPV